MSDEIRSIRLQKLARMRELGRDPYAVELWKRSNTAAGLLENFVEDQEVSFAGRVDSHRPSGKAGFMHITDGEGRIQVYVRADAVGDVDYELYRLLDLADHVGVEGKLFVTKTGERSIAATKIQPLSKTLVSVPMGKEVDGKEYDRPADPDYLYRNRHIDLITNRTSRHRLIGRAKVTSAVRRYFDSLGYLEVETPLLQLEAGGAAARPFLTHYNEYEIDVKLRISLELYLKRLICGEIDRVYEVGRVFRNEGVSNRHNPEFTLLEFYESYANLETMMERVEGCFHAVAESVFGSTVVEIDQLPGDVQDEDHPSATVTLDFGKPWRRVNLLAEIERHTGLTEADLTDLETAISALKERELVNPVTGKRIDPAAERNLGGFIEKLLEVFIEPTLQEPTFVIGYPIETSPLAKKDPNNPRMTRRFEGYILGKEVCNAFSEINDPVDQRERFEQQLAEAAKGDEEAHPMDEEFIYALECGMPPTGGCGIGIDRMALMLTGARHIREVLFFPFMKPKASAPVTTDSP
jgi:lysyl-tRNA synthetase class 2